MGFLGWTRVKEGAASRPRMIGTAGGAESRFPNPRGVRSLAVPCR